MNLQYGDKINYYEGVIVKVTDGAVGIDIKGRLGYIEIPMRMLITDYPIKCGQEVGFNMSFLEQLGPEVDEHYVSNQMTRNKKIEEMTSKNSKGE